MFVLMNVETKQYVKDAAWPVWMPEERYGTIDKAIRWDNSMKPNRIKADVEILMMVKEEN